MRGRIWEKRRRVKARRHPSFSNGERRPRIGARRTPKLPRGCWCICIFWKTVSSTGTSVSTLTVDLQLPYGGDGGVDGLGLSELKERLVELYHPYLRILRGSSCRCRNGAIGWTCGGLVQKPGRYLVDASTSWTKSSKWREASNRESPSLVCPDSEREEDFRSRLEPVLQQRRGPRAISPGGWGGETVFFQKDLLRFLEGSPAPFSVSATHHSLGRGAQTGRIPGENGKWIVDLLAQAGGFTENRPIRPLGTHSSPRRGRYAAEFSWSRLGTPRRRSRGISLCPCRSTIPKFKF